MSFYRGFGGTRLFPLSKFQWAPTLTAHDPDPPIRLEDGPSGTPFAQGDWPGATAAKPAVRQEQFVNLLPLTAPPPVKPFLQSDWPAATPPRKLPAPDFVPNLLAVQNPPAQAPFSETDWPAPSAPMRAAKQDAPPNLLPLGVRPFVKVDWPLAARARQPIRIEPTQSMLALFAPPAAAPFAQADWPLTAAPRRAAPDFFVVNLGPLQTPVVVGDPFRQTDWPLSARARPFTQAALPPYIEPPAAPPAPPADAHTPTMVVNVGTLMTRR